MKDTRIAQAAELYQRFGFILVPLTPGHATPIAADPRAPHGLVLDADAARSRFGGSTAYNIGFALEESRLSLLSVRYEAPAAKVFTAMALSLPTLFARGLGFDAPGRCCALFRNPAGAVLQPWRLQLPHALGFAGAPPGSVVASFEISGTVAVPPSVIRANRMQWHTPLSQLGPPLADVPQLPNELVRLSANFEPRAQAAIELVAAPATEERAIGGRPSVWVQRVLGVLVERQVAGQAQVDLSAVLETIRPLAGRSKSWRPRALLAIKELVAAGRLREAAGSDGGPQLDLVPR